MGNFTVVQKFLVANIMDEVILGMDFMLEHGVKLDLSTHTLKLGNVEIVLNTNNAEKAQLNEIIMENNSRPGEHMGQNFYGKIPQNKKPLELQQATKHLLAVVQTYEPKGPFPFGPFVASWGWKFYPVLEGQLDS